MYTYAPPYAMQHLSTPRTQRLISSFLPFLFFVVCVLGIFFGAGIAVLSISGDTVIGGLLIGVPLGLIGIAGIAASVGFLCSYHSR